MDITLSERFLLFDLQPGRWVHYTIFGAFFNGMGSCFVLDLF